MNEEEDGKQLLDEEDEKQLLGSRLFDAIDSNLHKAGEFIADAAEDKPGITDDIVRGSIQGLSFVGNLPVIKQIGQAEEAIVGGVRNLAERQDVIDPRLFTYGTRLGLAFAGDKAIGKIAKVGKLSKIGKNIPPPLKVHALGLDPTGATDDLLRQQAGLKMRLLNSIDPEFPQQRLNFGIDDNAYTQKFVTQPWESYQSLDPSLARTQDTLLRSTTGFGAKLDAPQPKGIEYRILRSKGPGRQPSTIVKNDIKLNTKHGYKFNTPTEAVNSAKKFRREIIRLMQVDRIRGEDAGTKAGFLKTSSKVNTVAGGVKDISESYFDYLTGYFNRYIRRGTVDNFDQAVKLEIPKVRGGQIFPGEIDTVQGSSSLVRELRLFTIAPDVYKSGAFSKRHPTYQSKLKNIIRRYSTAEKPRTYNARRNVFEYRFDAHHIDQIAEGWPLYRGLPKAEIPEMRKLVQEFGLDPGNAEGNMLLILNEFHKDYHNIYWPKAYSKMLAQGWDPDAMRTINTALGRKKYVQMYVEAITESRDEVLQAIEDNMDNLLAALDKRRADRVLQEIDQIDIDFENVADTVPSGILRDMMKDASFTDVTRWRNYQQALDYE